MTNLFQVKNKKTNMWVKFKKFVSGKTRIVSAKKTAYKGVKKR